MAEEEIRKNAALAGWTENAVADALRLTATASVKGSGAQSLPAGSSAGPATEKNQESTTPKQISGEVSPNQPRVTAPATGSGTTAPVPPTSPPTANGEAGPRTRLDRGVPDDYLIGAGDVLHISVYHEPDATVQGVVVRPDGKISMPLLKEVNVVGLTPSQLEKQITQDLSQFLAAPDVTVMVTAINSKKIYVVGAVKKEGPIPYTYRMSVLQALSEAGGLTDYAKRKKIYVLRNENGRDFKLAFDYDAVLKGEHMELNIPLMAGDTLVVPH